MPRRHLLAVLAVAALVLPLAVVSSSPAAKAPNVTFGSAVIVDPIHTFGEPDVRIRGKNVYVSGPWGTGTQRSLFEWSADGGHTFVPLHSAPISSVNESATMILGPGGGDTEISIDHNDKVYYSDLAALATLKMATWDPHARTMETNTLTNVTDSSNTFDRQWFALWDPPNAEAVRKATGYTGPLPVNYLQWNSGAVSTSAQTSYSTDGLHYAPSSMSIPVADDGPLAIDQQTGTVFQAIAHEKTNNIALLMRTRNPATPADPALLKSKIIHVANMPSGTEEGVLFPLVTIDEARTVYLVWGTQSEDTAAQNGNAWQIWYSYAPASSGWTKWSKPVRLSHPPTWMNVMPWAVAGAKGRIAAVWYGTEEANSLGDTHQAWDVYLSMVGDADTANPSIEQVKVTRHPMHYGSICFAGVNCIREQGNRNLADFFEVEVDPNDGAIVIVYDDTSNELVQNIPGTDTPLPTPIEGIVDHRGAPVVTVVRQSGGVGLYGKPIVAASSFGPGRLAGKAGDAQFDPAYGGEQVPSLDTQGLSLSADGNDLIFSLDITSLDETSGALSLTGAQALDYVVRWVGEPVDSPNGTRNPIYYAAAEVTDTGSPTFFAGTAQSVDLCSVSGCFPHTITYPAPPLGGTAVTGKLVEGTGGAPDRWEIRVPRDVVGGPHDGTMLESLSAFTMARNKPASLPMTNVEEELGISPVVVDALCCIDTSVAASRPSVLGAKVTRPAAAPKPKTNPKTTVNGTGLAATGVPAVPAGLVFALIAGAALMFRSTRRI
jgi:hypothetical protein